jgi:hypothetical protein
MGPQVVAPLAIEGLERDFQSFAPSAEAARSCWFKSGARNHLRANRSLGFCFEIRI